MLLGLFPVTALAETTGIGTSTGGDVDTDTESETEGETESETDFGSTTAAPWEPIHESTDGPPLWEGPRTNDPPIQIPLDDDGFCRVGGPASGAGVAALLFLLGLVRRRR